MRVLGLTALALGAAACSSPPSLVAAQAVRFASVVQGGADPAPLDLQISNQGDCDLSGAARVFTVDGSPWLSVDPQSFTVAAGGGRTLHLTAAAGTLAPGAYTGTLSLSGSCVTNRRGVPPVEVGVSLVVSRAQPVAAGTCDEPVIVSQFPAQLQGSTVGRRSIFADSRCSGRALGGEMVYRLDLPSAGRLTATVTVLSGDLAPVILLQPQCGDDDGSAPSEGCAAAELRRETTKLQVSHVQAGPHWLTVDGLTADGVSGTSGTFRLDVQLDPDTPVTAGDSCAAPQELALVNGVAEVESTTVGATDDATLSCGGFDTPDRVFHLAVPEGTWDLAVSAWTLNADEVQLSLGLLGSCDPGSELDCQMATGSPELGWTAYLTRTAVGPSDLYFWVEGAPNQAVNAGPFHLRARLSPPRGTGAACGTSSPVLAPNATYQGTTAGGSDGYGATEDNQYGCTPYLGVEGYEAIYLYEPTVSGVAVASVQPTRGFASVLALLDTCASLSCRQLVDVGQRGEPESITFAAQAGQTYVLVVDSRPDAEGNNRFGDFTISVTQ